MASNVHKMLVVQSCLTLCNAMDCILPGSSVHGIFRAKILERTAMPSPGALSKPGTEPVSPALTTDSLPAESPEPLPNSKKHGGCGGSVAKSCPALPTAWTVVRQAPLSKVFPRQESWRGLPFPSPYGHVSFCIKSKSI